MRNAAPASLLSDLVEDDLTWVRQCALWAVTQVKDPCIKDPLIKVLSSWEQLLDWRGESRLPVSRSLLFEFFDEVTLPTHVLSMTLSERRAWLRSVGISEWTPTFYDPTARAPWVGDRWTVISVCLERSHWDADDRVTVRLGAQWNHPERSRSVNIDGHAAWHAVNAMGEVMEGGGRGRGAHVAARTKPLEPNQSTWVDDVLTMQEPPDPGVYLLVFRGQRRSHCCYLVRVQRSDEYERRVSELLEDVGRAEVVKSLGRHRVRAAVPQLVVLFRDKVEQRDVGMSMLIAEALGRIGDPRAAPALLEYPYVSNRGHIGDTAQAIREIGPPAYPHCERRILAWRATLDDYVTTMPRNRRGQDDDIRASGVRRMLGLEMAMRTLGPHGSHGAVAAQLDLIGTLKAQFSQGLYEDALPVIVVYRRAVLTLAKRKPDVVVDAVWATRNRYDVSREFLKELRVGDPATARPICIQLWKQLQGDPNVSSDFRDSLERTVRRAAPKVLSESASRENQN
jgi:hypothetical protein